LGRYTIEVIAPQAEDQLAAALEAIATIHGGAVVESSSHRQYVNIFDCELSLAQEVEWLRNRFPETRFTVKEFM
jgi:hypothetical protein